MSLIVDVLKRAQKDAAAQRHLPPFVKYPHKEGDVIFKHVWLFRGAIGFGIVMIFMVLMMTLRWEKPTPRADMFYKPVTRPQKILVALPEAHNPQEKTAPMQKEKTKSIEPEKRVTVPSQKSKKMISDNAGGKVLLKKSPFRNVTNHFYVALSHQKRGEKEKALEGYKKIVAMDPMNVEAHTNLGVIYKDMGKPVLAVKEFQMVLSMNPGHEKAHNNLGVIFYLRGNLEKAIQKFREVLAINSRNKEAYINLGVIYKQRNRISKAKRMFENALSIDPYSPEAHYNLGLIADESKDIKAAVSCYRKFVDFSGSTYPELTVKIKSRLKMLAQAQEG